MAVSDDGDASSAVEWDRPFLYAAIDVGDGPPLHVINLHLRAPRAAFIPDQKSSSHSWRTMSGWAEGFFLATVKRTGQALEARLFIDRLFDAEPNAHIVVCGDFNADDHETPVRTIRGDEEDAGNPHLTLRTLVPLDRSVADSRRFSVVHHGRPQMLDHLLVSRPLLGWYRGIEIHNEALGDELITSHAVHGSPESFHAPVVAEFAFAGSNDGRPLESRFVGCLIGQCVGDAVGFMVEGYPPDSCRQYADGVLLQGLQFEGRRGAFALGQYSDDSQLARELMASFVDRRSFDPADYARRIAAIFAENRIVGYGRATADAAQRLLAGAPWHAAGTPPPNASNGSNGSAMRAGPVGLMFRNDADTRIAAAHDQGRITHADPRCSAGAVAIAGAVALALSSEAVEPSEFLDRLAGWASEIEPVLAGVLLDLVGWLGLPLERAAPLIAAAGGPDFRDVDEGISPYVVPSVAWSLYAFLRHPEDFVRAIHTAVSVGGDADTTAAMTGAIAGARCGVESIPAFLVGRLTDRGTWEAGKLAGLARALWQIVRED